MKTVKHWCKSENCKTLMKEIEDDTKKWKDSLCFWIGRVNIVKNVHTTQSNPRIQCSPYQTPMAFFIELEKSNSKICSGHRTGKGQFSFQSQRKAMPNNAQTTAQLHSSHTLVK